MPPPPRPAAADPGDPDVGGAAAAIVVDASDGTTLFGKAPGERRAIASTTKLMTALLALERARPSDVFTAPAYDALPQESKINLREGERMRVRDLLEALLLESANDAAVTIAEGVSGSRAAFVEDMNTRAAELGLRDTSYANPIGLDDKANYSTASDLARLAARLMRNRRFARIVDLPAAELESGARRRIVGNRNDLIAKHPFVTGIKTGHTQSAGYVLVGSATGANGARVVTVVLGEPGEAARNADTLTLLRWGLARFRRVPRCARAAAGAPGGRLPRRARRARAAPRARRDRAPGPARDAPGARALRAGGAAREGARAGSVTVLRDGRPVRTVPLVTARPVPAASTLEKALCLWGYPCSALLVGILGDRRCSWPCGSRAACAS